MVDSFTPVNISERAMKEVKIIMENKSIPKGYGLRVGIKGAGCSGISYLVGFDTKKETDVTYTKEGVTIMIEKKHVMYLIGIELDFYEGDDARGFTFKSIDNNQL